MGIYCSTGEEAIYNTTSYLQSFLAFFLNLSAVYMASGDCLWRHEWSNDLGIAVILQVRYLGLVVCDHEACLCDEEKRNRPRCYK